MISTALRSLLMVFILLFAAQPIRMSSAQGNQERAGPAPYYSLLTEGMLAGPVFPYQFQSAKLRLEVHAGTSSATWVMESTMLRRCTRQMLGFPS